MTQWLIRHEPKFRLLRFLRPFPVAPGDAVIRLAFGLVLFCVASMLNATPPLTITDSGYYVTELNADGVPSLVAIGTIVDLRTGDTPKPPDETPPDDPEPRVNVQVVKDVQGWAETADNPQASQAIAAVYSHVRGALEDDTISPLIVWQVLKDATDAALEATGAGSLADVRTKMSDLITEGRQKGDIESKESIDVLLLSIQHGLELSADGSVALTMDELTRIARKTNEAIDAAK